MKAVCMIFHAHNSKNRFQSHVVQASDCAHSTDEPLSGHRNEDPEGLFIFQKQRYLNWGFFLFFDFDAKNSKIIVKRLTVVLSTEEFSDSLS
jgi:hypothetical protein